uniref:SHSP domain-containing protein n=1 Tax=Lotharella globosa TaxID=91324 RepID=A0A7S3YGD9_9EUKA
MYYYRPRYTTTPFYRRASPFAPMLTPFSRAFFDDDDDDDYMMEPEPIVFFRPVVRRRNVDTKHHPTEDVESEAKKPNEPIASFTADDKDTNMEVDRTGEQKKKANDEKDASSVEKESKNAVTTTSSTGKDLASLLDDGWQTMANIETDEDERAHHYKLSGLKDDSIEINLEHGNNLVISGKTEKKTENGFYTSSFKRSFTLPANVEKQAIRAEFKDGNLAIHVPKTPVVPKNAKRSIPIKMDK